MTAPQAGHTGGLVHAVGFYDSDEEFGRRFAPFCDAGTRSGEPVVVCLEPHKMELLRAVLHDPGEVVFVPHADQYAHAPGALASVLDLLERHAADGSQPLRVLGELPPMPGLSQDPWMRYERAVNHLLADRPVRSVCPCDTRTTPADVQAEMLRCHHAVVTPDGKQSPNPGFEPPESSTAGGFDGVRDPLEDDPPAVELVDPSPSAARQAIGGLARAMGLVRSARDSLRVAANEILSNALLHGAQPVVLQAWGRPGRVVVAVQDAGPGPTGPLVGLLPANGPIIAEGGLGLWITHQLCPETALSAAGGGFTVRVAAGDPDADAAPLA